MGRRSRDTDLVGTHTPSVVTNKQEGISQTQRSFLRIERLEPHTGHQSSGDWHQEDEPP